MGNCVTEIPAADSQATIDQYTGRFRVETDCAAVADPARRISLRSVVDGGAVFPAAFLE